MHAGWRTTFLGAGLSCTLLLSAEAWAQSTRVPTIVPPSPSAGAAPLRPGPRTGSTVRPGTPTVNEIQVEGTQRIEPDTVRSYMALKPGDAFDTGKVNESLKALFATGLFADVTIRRQGQALVVQVVENPVINRIAFEGNKHLDDETLDAEVQLRPRIVFTRKRVQSDVKRILEVYRAGGRFSASVDPKVIQLAQNRVDLVFEIKEGPVTGIRRIAFVGNRFFSDGSLRGVIQTKESRRYRFLSSADNYDPDRLTFDRELLRRHYLENGFADFRVLSAVAELTPDQTDFFVTFTVEEGERYKFDKIDVISKIEEIDPAEIKPLIEIKSGAWYSAAVVDSTLLTLTNLAGDRGFAFVEVRPQVTRNRENRTIDITFQLLEGPRVFVERIEIRGNVRTLDKVIRREFRLVEGDAFNSAKLRRSRQRLLNLGYFAKAEISNTVGSTPDKTVVKLDVEEQSTGEISLGFGFSTTEGGLVDIGLKERNFLGRGQDVRASFTISQRTQNFDVGFTEPYFLDKDISAGIDLFRTQRDNSDESSFTSERVGFGLRAQYEINESWSQRFRYLLRNEEIEDIDSDASRFIRDQEGGELTSLIGQDLTYDKLNSKLDPTDGYFARLSTDFAGVGGDAQYLRMKLSSAYYIPFGGPWVLSFSGEVGHIINIGEEIRINDRFFLGGDDLRGFETAGVGPRDSNTADALGGLTSAVGTIELAFPLGLPEELGFSGAVFSDIGTLVNSVAEGNIVQDEPTLRIAVGIGLAWRSPFGPVRIDFAIPVVSESFDKEEIVRFNFGTRF